jgi:hypothetical protein
MSSFTGSDRAKAAPKGDSLGDRIKAYEAAETGRALMPLLPIIGRIDGRCFSAFTRGMDRPYDKLLHACMVETTKRLLKETQATAGYTQSDEITLLWHGDNHQTQTIFGGKPFKMMSVAASLTTSIFVELAREYWPEKIAHGPVSFDCRVFQVPNKDEACNAFLWREKDATKNAISMAARLQPERLHDCRVSALRTRPQGSRALRAAVVPVTNAAARRHSSKTVSPYTLSAIPPLKMDTCGSCASTVLSGPMLPGVSVSFVTLSTLNSIVPFGRQNISKSCIDPSA